MSDNAIAVIEKECLAIADNLTNDQVMAIYDRICFYSREIKRIKDLAETAVMEWIKANGDLNAGNGIRYYVGTDKTTKCKDVAATVEAILVAVEGDAKRFTDILSANAIKHGAAKKVLPPEVYEQLFEVVVRETLEEGKPKTKLVRFDEKFTR
jgi:uncharacterized protein YpmB